MKTSAKYCFSLLGASVLALAVPAIGYSQLGNPPMFTSIYSFPSGPGGQGPNGKLLIGNDGTLYGTTYYGGDANNDGTIYSLTPGMGGVYTETVLYTFTGGATGSHPTAGLMMGSDGALYGTAAGTGTTTGVVFQLVPPITGSTWTYNVIHYFGGAGDGSDPNCDLVMSPSGTIFGTTVRGGTSNQGTVFSLQQSGGVWTEAVIHNFTAGSDGSRPYSGLTFDSAGALYGTAGAGGAHFYGTVFKLTPPTSGTLWNLRTLYAFSGPDGKFPLAGVYVDSSKNVYGTTYVGGGQAHGAVFKLTLSGGTYSESVIYAFSGPDGSNPSDALTPDGSGGFYTTTGAARAGTGGNVVHLTPPASGTTYNETVLYAFTGGTDGQAPLASVTLNPAGTALYGTSFYGGDWGSGTVFRIQ